MNNKKITYHFEPVLECEMCGDLTEHHKVIGIRMNRTQGFRPKKKDGITVSVKRCRKCGLHYASPMPVPNSIHDHYEVPPEEYWIPEYFEINEHYYVTQLNTAKKLIGYKPGMTALDIGAGLGKAMIAMEKAGFDTWGIEASDSYRQAAISRMKIHSDRLKSGMIEDTDFPENSFDFISYGAVLEHLYHPAYCISKAMKWLKPGGAIFIEVPSAKYFAARLVNFYYRLRGTNFVCNISPMHTPFHLYEFTHKSFLELAQRSGFKVSKYKYLVAKTILFPRIMRPPLDLYMKWTGTGMQLEMWLSK